MRPDTKSLLLLAILLLPACPEKGDDTSPLVTCDTGVVETGCYSPETFVEARINATCTWYQRCDILNAIGYETVADCVDAYTADAEQSGDLGETCEPYDRSAATQCVDELNAAGCEDDFPYPASCSEACPAE